MKILVADDDRVSLMMMRRMLLPRGYEVLTVSDGAAAVQAILQDDGPRLVLLDWMMPSLTGLEVCRAVRSSVRKGYVYIILLSAKGSKEDLITGLQAGADDFLSKPCHPEELAARLRTGHRILQLEDGLVEARDQMHFKATHDALTQVLNRGAIVHTLEQHIEQTRSSSKSAAVLLCDVDHFKHINDTYGHPVGDEVLRSIAHRLGSITLGNDTVGRFGGEEFLLVLEDVDRDRVGALGTNICEMIRSSPVETSAGPITVSISVGIVQVDGFDTACQVDDVLKRADILLYQAKRQGRDRAVAETFEDTSLASSQELLFTFPPALLAI